jgi:hypothetical protein
MEYTKEENARIIAAATDLYEAIDPDLIGVISAYLIPETPNGIIQALIGMTQKQKSALAKAEKQ